LLKVFLYTKLVATEKAEPLKYATSELIAELRLMFACFSVCSGTESQKIARCIVTLKVS